MADDIEEQMRGVVARHRAEWGARADQMLVNDRLYPQEIEAWAATVARLRAARDFLNREVLPGYMVLYEEAGRGDYIESPIFQRAVALLR